MSSVIRFKFGCSVGYDFVRFDGVEISIRELKAKIARLKNVDRFGRDCDLRVTNEQSGVAYLEDDLVYKNGSVVVSRVPMATAKGQRNKVESKKTGDDGKAMDLVDLGSADLSEEEKLLRVMAQGGEDFQNLKRKRRPLPENYVCHLCGVRGHYIQDCPKKPRRNGGAEPLLKLKLSHGIPETFLIPTDDASNPAAMLTADGKLVIPKLAVQTVGKLPAIKEEEEEEEREAEEEGKRKIPPEMICPICEDILTDPFVMLCCQRSGCDVCVVTNVSDRCPLCSRAEVSFRDVRPNHELRAAIEAYKNARNGRGTLDRAGDCRPVNGCTLDRPDAKREVVLGPTGPDPGEIFWSSPVGATTGASEPGRIPVDGESSEELADSADDSSIARLEEGFESSSKDFEGDQTGSGVEGQAQDEFETGEDMNECEMEEVVDELEAADGCPTSSSEVENDSDVYAANQSPEGHTEAARSVVKSPSPTESSPKMGSISSATEMEIELSNIVLTCPPTLLVDPPRVSRPEETRKDFPRRPNPNVRRGNDFSGRYGRNQNHRRLPRERVQLPPRVIDRTREHPAEDRGRWNQRESSIDRIREQLNKEIRDRIASSQNFRRSIFDGRIGAAPMNQGFRGKRRISSPAPLLPTPPPPKRRKNSPDRQPHYEPPRNSRQNYTRGCRQNGWNQNAGGHQFFGRGRGYEQKRRWNLMPQRGGIRRAQPT